MDYLRTEIASIGNSLHAGIMNIRSDKETLEFKKGCKKARHQAASLSSAAMAEVLDHIHVLSEMRTVVTVIDGEIHTDFVVSLADAEASVMSDLKEYYDYPEDEFDEDEIRAFIASENKSFDWQITLIAPPTFQAKRDVADPVPPAPMAR